jgi:predicted RNA-binding Zn-ribbon protein involved in translation (DUF1610 family)
MTDEQPAAAKLEKICLDNECQDHWNELPAELARFTSKFVYCPFCSEELNLQCSACKESLTSKDYKFCPWCGLQFQE